MPRGPSQSDQPCVNIRVYLNRAQYTKYRTLVAGSGKTANLFWYDILKVLTDDKNSDVVKKLMLPVARNVVNLNQSNGAKNA